MNPIECLYVRLVNGLEEEQTVYAYLCGDASPNYVLDEAGRDVPNSELPAEFWPTVIAHAVDREIQKQVCYINL